MYTIFNNKIDKFTNLQNITTVDEQHTYADNMASLYKTRLLGRFALIFYFNCEHTVPGYTIID